MSVEGRELTLKNVRFRPRTDIRAGALNDRSAAHSGLMRDVTLQQWLQPVIVHLDREFLRKCIMNIRKKAPNRVLFYLFIETPIGHLNS